MKDLSLYMGLMDFIPVILFTAACVMLQRDLYNKMSKGAFALFSMGTLDIVFAGSAKALYKVLYGAGVCDFQPLNNMFFPVQSIGFLVAGIAALAMLCHKQGRGTVFSVAPPIFMGTFIFVGFMCIGLGLIYTVLSIIAVKMKKPASVILFVCSFILSLGMGYLSSKDFSLAIFNWIAQGVNVFAQGFLLIGTIGLHKAGLADYVIERKENADEFAFGFAE